MAIESTTRSGIFASLRVCHRNTLVLNGLTIVQHPNELGWKLIDSEVKRR